MKTKLLKTVDWKRNANHDNSRQNRGKNMNIEWEKEQRKQKRHDSTKDAAEKTKLWLYFKQTSCARKNEIIDNKVFKKDIFNNNFHIYLLRQF